MREVGPGLERAMASDRERYGSRAVWRVGLGAAVFAILATWLGVISTQDWVLARELLRRASGAPARPAPDSSAP